MSKSELNRHASHPGRPGRPAVHAPLSTSRKVSGLAVAALVLAALNLRPGVTSLGPVLEEVRDSLSMSGTLSGVLTSIPAACFALVGSAAPLLARRYGAAGAIAAAAAVLTAGLALRPLAADAALFVALTALSLAGIAIANVLLPAVVKERFPDRVGAMTGLYSMALNAGASSAAAVTVPLTEAFGGDWRYGLGAWSVLAAMAVPPWLALARRRPPPDAGRADANAPQQAPAPVRLSRDPTAWALTAYFGLQASSAYIIIGWLPQIFRDAGLSAQSAGLLFSGTSLLGVPLSFALSAVAGKLSHQSGIAAAIGVCGLAGYAGLWADPATAPWLWAFLLGVANCSFPLALTMIGMRGRDGTAVVRLSGFVQGFGYLLSIPGPVAVGVLYDSSGGWRLPLSFILLLTLVQIGAGLLAGRNRQIG
ncbi:MFS transporter [Streptomyces sp. ME02-8801-2C]|uniref:CynX/NimT family MFS transporter n=1 Tax=Streptomyces sp. ME02-8801-2C TaxID=3028680 RepID=UPI0029BF5100|nr:MFS transporter [Streptomyces sp. ME02-8801-2C]MDX3455519.1 MFS transporter [Streptomyces sp. ME02-8801-2C]